MKVIEESSSCGRHRERQRRPRDRGDKRGDKEEGKKEAQGARGHTKIRGGMELKKRALGSRGGGRKGFSSTGLGERR